MPGSGEPLPLRDIHLPESLPLWPPAPILYVLAALALAALAAFLLRRRRRNAAPDLQALALKELVQLEQGFAGGQDAADCLRSLSALLRRSARARNPLSAGLWGEPWLACLDAGDDARPFFRGPGRLLLEGPYCEGACSRDELAELLRLSRRHLERWEEVKLP